jgi:hypothetical protein
MHRSGTSLISRVANLLGVDLGPERRLRPGDPANPKGFWEYAPFLHVNNRLLWRHHGSWKAPPSLPSGWHRSARVLDQRLRARFYAARDFRGSELWGWKDPRTCLTLPFWQHLFPDLTYVVCFRNPVDVARSHERRDGFDFATGIDLWLRYMDEVMRHTADSPRLFVSYDELFDDPAAPVQSLAEFLERSDPATVERTLDDVSAYVDAGLRHSAATLSELQALPHVPQAVKNLYESLLATTAHGDLGTRPAGIEQAVRP